MKKRLYFQINVKIIRREARVLLMPLLKYKVQCLKNLGRYAPRFFKN